MGRLKPSNLVSGFKAAGIYPLDPHQVLKRLPDESGDDSINESIFNDAVLNILKENCGIGVPKKQVQIKRGKKVRYRQTCFRCIINYLLKVNNRNTGTR